MKKMKTYISILALGALALTFNACTDEPEWEPSPAQTEGIMAYIDIDTPTSYTYLPDDEQAFEITFGRQVSTEAATIHLTTEGDDVFTVPETVDFAAGESEKTIKVTFDIPTGSSASIRIALGEGETYLYGLTEQTFSVTRDYTWEDAGTAMYNDPTFTGQTFDVAIQSAKEQPGLYRLVNLLEEGYHLQFELDENYNAVSLLPVGALYTIATGYDMLYDPASYGSGYCFFTNEGSNFSLGYLFTDDGSSLYVGTGSFEWIEDYPGEEATE